MTTSTAGKQQTFPDDKIMIVISISLVMMGFVMAYMMRSWNGYFSLMGLALLGAVFSCSWSHWRLWRLRLVPDSGAYKERAGRELAQVHLLVVSSVLGAVCLFLVGLVERLVWANANDYPRVLLHRDYIERDGRLFDVNEYRLFREFVCREKGPMEIRDDGEGVYYLRCGMSFPDAQVVRVSKADFEAAAAESKNYKEGDPIVIHRGDPEN